MSSKNTDERKLPSAAGQASPHGERQTPVSGERSGASDRSLEQRLDQDADLSSQQRKGAGMGESRQGMGNNNYQHQDENTGRNIGENTDQRTSDEADSDLANEPTEGSPLDRR